MGRDLEVRLRRLEHRAADQALCTDSRCKHLDLVRLHRRANGLPEYPLPPHLKNPDPRGFVELLARLNRQASASPDGRAKDARPGPYIDPFQHGAAA